VFGQVYDFAEANNLTFVGGTDRTVGASGGWVQVRTFTKHLMTVPAKRVPLTGWWPFVALSYAGIGSGPRPSIQGRHSLRRISYRQCMPEQRPVLRTERRRRRDVWGCDRNHLQSGTQTNQHKSVRIDQNCPPCRSLTVSPVPRSHSRIRPRTGKVW
jgi:hypothetical protein